MPNTIGYRSENHHLYELLHSHPVLSEVELAWRLGVNIAVLWSLSTGTACNFTLLGFVPVETGSIAKSA